MISECVLLPLNTMAMTFLFFLHLVKADVPSPPFSLSSLPELLLQLVDLVEVIQLLSMEIKICFLYPMMLIISLILLMHERGSRMQ